jgi:HlyD family secretion protein
MCDTRNAFLCRLALALAVAVAVGVLAGGCGPSSTRPAETGGTNTAVTTVKGERPQWKGILRVVEQPGTVQAYEETRLFARVPGYVRLPYDNGRIVSDIGHKIRGPSFDSTGKEVEPGEVLAEVVVPELLEETKKKDALTREAEADVELAEKNVLSAKANIAIQEAAVIEGKSQQDRWTSEMIRIEKAAKGGAIDLQVRDETQNQLKAAGARLLGAEAAVLKALADRDKVAAQVLSAKAHVEVARADALRSWAMLGYAKIRAPYDGVVTMRKANTGDFVQPDAAKGEWLFTVARLDPIRVVVAVPEADSELVREHCKVKLVVPALSNRALLGTVCRTSWSLEQGARTLRTEIDLPNEKHQLRPGMYVYAYIEGQAAAGWTLPVAALAKQGEVMVCFLIEGGKVLRTPIQVGRGDGQIIQVLKGQKLGSHAVWEAFTGTEMVAVRATGLVDGQSVLLDSSVK